MGFICKKFTDAFQVDDVYGGGGGGGGSTPSDSFNFYLANCISKC